jgi:hypothetical protein
LLIPSLQGNFPRASAAPLKNRVFFKGILEHTEAACFKKTLLWVSSGCGNLVGFTINTLPGIHLSLPEQLLYVVRINILTSVVADLKYAGFLIRFIQALEWLAQSIPVASMMAKNLFGGT